MANKLVEDGMFNAYFKTSSLFGENTKNVFDECIKLTKKGELALEGDANQVE